MWIRCGSGNEGRRFDHKPVAAGCVSSARGLAVANHDRAEEARRTTVRPRPANQRGRRPRVSRQWDERRRDSSRLAGSRARGHPRCSGVRSWQGGEGPPPFRGLKRAAPSKTTSSGVGHVGLALVEARREIKRPELSDALGDGTKLLKRRNASSTEANAALCRLRRAFPGPRRSWGFRLHRGTCVTRSPARILQIGAAREGMRERRAAPLPRYETGRERDPWPSALS